MKRQLIIDMVPQTRGGDVVYINGLGAPSAAFTTTTTNVAAAVNVASSVVDTIPRKPITVQSDFSKVANVVATGASVVAAATVWFPAAAIVAGIVAAAAALLGKIFANSKSKAYAVERGQYEVAIAQLQYENLELDRAYTETANAISQLRSAVSSLSGLNGALGLCIFNCKKNAEKEKLDSAKSEYELLNKANEEKTKLMSSLLDEYNRLMLELLTLRSSQSTKNTALYLLISAAVLGAGFAIYSSTKK